MGLNTLGMPSCPGILVFMPIFGQRPVLHLKEYIPEKWAGTRTEPATSEPMPMRPPP